MSEAVERVRLAIELWQRNDRDANWSLYAEDATMNAPRDWPETGSYAGRDEIRAVFDGFDDAFGSDWPKDIGIKRIDDLGGGRVLVEYDWSPSGVSSGASVAGEIAGIFTVTGDKITHIDFFTSFEEARRAAGIE